MVEVAHLTDPIDGTAEIIALVADPSTSYWLRHAVTTALDRDPFDAERDALMLASLLTRRVESIVARHFGPPR